MPRTNLRLVAAQLATLADQCESGASRPYLLKRLDEIREVAERDFPGDQFWLLKAHKQLSLGDTEKACVSLRRAEIRLRRMARRR